jgi:hypothetical protein
MPYRKQRSARQRVIAYKTTVVILMFVGGMVLGKIFQPKKSITGPTNTKSVLPTSIVKPNKSWHISN